MFVGYKEKTPLSLKKKCLETAQSHGPKEIVKEAKLVYSPNFVSKFYSLNSFNIGAAEL